MIKKFLRYLSRYLPDACLAYLYFIWRHRYIPNFRNPESFSEKLGYIKLYNNLHLRKVVVDRLEVRDYVESCSVGCSLVNLHWVGQRLTESMWNDLPQKFVIKANHGSGMVLVVDKSTQSYREIEPVTRVWMDTDYSDVGREWWYKNLKRYLLIEEYLEFGSETPPDFKFFCFSGKIGFIQVDQNRFSGHYRNLYTPEWEEINIKLVRPRGDPIPKPLNFQLARLAAEELSRDFDFIRVDLYLLSDHVYFGELTNAPGNGFEKYSSKKFDFYLGSLMPKHPNR